MGRAVGLAWALCLACGCDVMLQLDHIPVPHNGVIAWDGPFASDIVHQPNSSEVLTGRAQSAGDAVVLHVACITSSAPQDVTVTSPGNWDWHLAGQIVGTAQEWAAVFTAIAPDSTMTDVTVSWTGAVSPACDSSMHAIGDAFSGTAGTNDELTFDAVFVNASAGSCHGQITPRHDNDAVWAACTSDGRVDVGPDFTEGANDTSGDITEFKITTDAAGTVQTADYAMINSTQWALTVVSLAPR